MKSKRSLKSARQAGARFETLVATWLKTWVDERVERRHLAGVNDRGDITGLYHGGHRVVVECKDYGGRVQLAEWMREAEIEAANDDADICFIVAKRRGTTAPGEQWVITTLDQMTTILTCATTHRKEKDNG